uniref:HNH nuclease domain-containing protein n=1 Tax=viral metagenome TaxID=1070528 RepID=A0A6C0KWT0_9ZZZZ
MSIKLWIIIICALILYNIHYESNILSKLKKYKKYYKMMIVVIMGFGALSVVNKSPKMSYDNMKTLQEFIQVMPIDRQSKDILTPFLSSNSSGTNQAKEHVSIRKMESSGSKGTKRSVSETKKKYVASQQNWTCNKCNQKLNHTFEVDHKVRLEYGGTNEVSNLEALCRECHGQKTSFENF